MNEFISWETLATYSGALAMVMVLCQFTKDLAPIKKIPTQIWSFILALFVMIPAQFFLQGLSIDILFQAIFNAVIVSIAANGGYQGIKMLTGNKNDGNFLIDSSNDTKDIYRLDLNTELDKLSGKRTISLSVKPNSKLE